MIDVLFFSLITIHNSLNQNIFIIYVHINLQFNFFNRNLYYFPKTIFFFFFEFGEIAKSILQILIIVLIYDISLFLKKNHIYYLCT